MFHEDILTILADCFFEQKPLSEILDIDTMQALVRSCDIEQRLWVAKTLAFDTNNPSAIHFLCQLANDKEVEVRVEAVDSLSAHPCEETFLTLCSALRDTNDYVRAYAAYGVAVVGRAVSPEIAVSLLTEALDKMYGVFSHVALYEGLYILGDHSHMEKLFHIFQINDDYHVKCWVLRALTEILDSNNQNSISKFVTKLDPTAYPTAVKDAICQLNLALKDNTKNGDVCD